jgi:hypothetical protein
MTSTRILALSMILAAATVAPEMCAKGISYSDSVIANFVTLGSTAFQCSPGTDCVVVNITFFSDTNTVMPFSVVGASGFENLTGSGFVTVNGALSAAFLSGQIYVSVDQTNGGAGFGSAYEPTYPLATYGISGTYDLVSDFAAPPMTGPLWVCDELRAKCSRLSPSFVWHSRTIGSATTRGNPSRSDVTITDFAPV